MLHAPTNNNMTYYLYIMKIAQMQKWYSIFRTSREVARIKKENRIKALMSDVYLSNGPLPSYVKLRVVHFMTHYSQQHCHYSHNHCKLPHIHIATVHNRSKARWPKSMGMDRSYNSRCYAMRVSPSSSESRPLTPKHALHRCPHASRLSCSPRLAGSLTQFGEIGRRTIQV